MTDASASAPAVVGGQPISITQAPWQVFIDVRDEWMCGGAILSATWVLTAAHCIDMLNTGELAAPSEVTVHSGISSLTEAYDDHGSPAGNETHVVRIVMNPRWVKATYANDFALLQLGVPLVASERRQSVALPVEQDPSIWPAAGTPAEVIGWGTTTPDGTPSVRLMRGDVQILDDPQDPVCGEYVGWYEPEEDVCAGLPTGGVDACYGDSGGGLIVRVADKPTIAAVVNTGNGCGRTEYPGIYARVTNELPWMLETIGTPGMAPAAPRAVRAVSLGRGRVRVSWQAPVTDGGSAITGYVAKAGRRACRSSATSCTIRGLTPRSIATITVVASNPVGTSAPARARVRVR